MIRRAELDELTHGMQRRSEEEQPRDPAPPEESRADGDAFVFSALVWTPVYATLGWIWDRRVRGVIGDELSPPVAS